MKRLPEQGYYNPAAETLPRERISELQWRKLQHQLRHAYARSRHWRARMDAHGCAPDSLASLDDYAARFPLTERADLTLAQAAAPPFGDLPSVDPRLSIARHQTSGSSGMPPVRTFDTARDWAWIADMFAVGLYGLGIRPSDQVAVAFGYGMFIGFWAGHYGLQRLGATAISTGSFDSEKRIELLTSEDIRGVLCTPTYALRLSQVARGMGVDLAADTNVAIVVTSGEPRPPHTRALIQSEWGAFCGEVAGMTEAGTLLMFECGPEARGMHVIETDVFEEVLSPETREPVGYGEHGVRVLTALGRESLSLFRYWTNDIVVKQPAESCTCGRTWDYYEGGILGRADDIVKVRGVLFTPSMVEDIARSFEDIVEFQTELQTVGPLDTLAIAIEPRVGLDDERRHELRQRFAAKVKRDIGVTPTVRLATAEELPRFEMKAQRFRDLRAGRA